jgi:hypothetical protein
MSGTLLQLLGFVAVVALLVTILLRPGGVLLAVLAVGFVIAGIVVSWRDVAQHRAQKTVTQQQRTASVLARPAEYPRSGS